MRRAFVLSLLSVLGVVGAQLIAAPAFAHGYVSAPPSRQALCARGVVQCGDIKYEPQSVEGPKGLHSCSAGIARFAELDDNSKNWPATSVGTSVTFTWAFTARHATSTFDYYIGTRKIASFNLNGQQPPSTLSHPVSLSGYSGRQTVLSVWNVSDTPNAFYSCVDVQIGGGTTPPPTGGCSVAAWNSAQAYVGGSRVAYNGHVWSAKWWTQGETPGVASVWTDQGACASAASATVVQRLHAR
jgi:predicted carbohydrate-binding protein with CBM5 and CBM33 domain